MQFENIIVTAEEKAFASDAIAFLVGTATKPGGDYHELGTKLGVASTILLKMNPKIPKEDGEPATATPAAAKRSPKKPSRPRA